MMYRVVTKTEAGWLTHTFDGVDSLIAGMEIRGHKVTGTNHAPQQREELQGQPHLSGLCGPMWDGDAVRYECPAAYATMSA